MKKKLSVFLSLLVSLSFSFLLSWCGNSNSVSNSYWNTECSEPENPYGDGWGHDAGFNRAEQNGEDCNGNSDSFNEGCEEYYSQLEKYQNCIND